MTPAPPITAVGDDSLLRRVLREEYQCELLACERLPGEADETIRVQTATGHLVVKRCSVEQRGDVDAQVLALDRLRAALPAATPLVLRTRTGAATVTTGDTLLRVLTWVPGQSWRQLATPPARLLTELGELAAATLQALSDLPPDPFRRTHPWDLRHCADTVAAALSSFDDPDAALLTRVSEHAQTQLDRLAGQLPCAVTHHDLNDHNVLVSRDADGCWRISGLVDVGDVVYTHRICELAIAAAYAMLRTPDPIGAAVQVVAGFHRRLPLNRDELAVVLPLAIGRLAVNAAVWTRRRGDGVTPDYAETRMRHTRATLHLLASVPEPVMLARLALALGGIPEPPVAPTPAVAMVDAETVQVVDLSPAGDLFAERIRVAGERLVVGRHGEPRRSRAARRSSTSAPETVHLGIDVFMPAGTVVAAPWDADVTAHPAGLLLCAPDRPTVLLDGLTPVTAESPVLAGDVIGTITGRPCEPDAPPHLHLQLVHTGATPRFVSPAQATGWAAAYGAPSLLLGPGIDAAQSSWTDPAPAVLASRRKHLAGSQRNYYADPMVITEAEGVWFTDHRGQRYLDVVNNVTHLGHGHPAVVDAVAQQMRRLNTNSRFVYPEMSEYVRRLAELLPDPLEVVFLVCSGSEANDLALRIARGVTGREHVAVIDGAYHGNTTAVTAISPHRYAGPGGTGRPATTLEVPTPDRYRGPYGYHDPASGTRYAADAARIISAAGGRGEAPAAVIAESLMGTAGQIVHPPGYLHGLYSAARDAGALCIADEVQVGFGRLGTARWGFELGGVVPDIVTLGKPIGNGHPLSAVITTRAIADAFDTGMKYFNTFGGNPVSCAAGSAVLDVLADGALQAHADQVGRRLRGLLGELAQRHPLIGDVRGQGLYLGIELVSDREKKTPAGAAAYAISERLKDDGVITWPNGIHDNVLKIKPPMVFTDSHADLLVTCLDRVLAEGW